MICRLGLRPLWEEREGLLRKEEIRKNVPLRCLMRCFVTADIVVFVLREKASYPVRFG